MFVFLKKAKSDVIRLIENKIWQLSLANIEIQSRMLLGEMISGKEYTKPLLFVSMRLNYAITDLKIELLRSFLPEDTIDIKNKGGA